MSEAIVKTETQDDDEENGRITPVRISVLQYEQTMKDVLVNQETPTYDEGDSSSLSNINSIEPETSGVVENKNAESQNNNTAVNINILENILVVPQITTEIVHAQNTASETEVSVQSLSGDATDPKTIDTAGVLVKGEPQDTDLADLEQTIARLDGQCTDEIASPPPPPISQLLPPQTTTIPPTISALLPPTNTTDPPQISTAPPQISTPPPQISTSKDVGTDTAVQTIPHHLSPQAIGVLIKEELQDTTFSELEEAMSELDNKGKNSADETADTPPPPPTISNIRLRVKPEFMTTPQETIEECSSLPPDFFEDFPIDVTRPTTLPDIEPKEERIPDNFFDDILVDKVQERIEQAETEDLEEKYVDRLKQLEELQQLEREKKKHKKSKKKSNKRIRSPSPPTRRRGNRSPTPERVKHNLMRWPDNSGRDDWMESPSTSKRQRFDKEFDIRSDDLRRKLANKRRSADNVTPMLVDDNPPKRRTPVGEIEILDEPVNDGVQPHLPEIREDFTPKQKRDRIILRAKTLSAYLNSMEEEKYKPLSTFLYTSIVRKLPASHSYRNQHIYENRSPLHNINNVSYKFNSHARSFNLEEWGLCSLPPLAANVAKLVGCDAMAIYNKLKVIKVPARIRKIKTEDGNDEDDEDEDETLRARSSLFCNASTQTDEMVDIFKRKPKGYDIGVQAVQPASEMACQTLETESPTVRKYDNSDDLPIMAIMRELNENQLMALHDFAELLKEPASNAMDMYRLRQRMLDIYKCSQLPSAIPTPVASVNSYTSNEHVPALRIQSAAGADGSCVSVNDPRNNFTGRRHRDIDNEEVIGNVNPRDPRFSHFSRPQDESRWPYNAPMPNQQRQQQQHHPITHRHQQQPSNGQKFYGRGGLRR